MGEFYSVALTNGKQQADTGTKMVHVGKDTRSRIVSKGISAGSSRNAYRGLVQVGPGADRARNYSQCDSMLIGDGAGANTYPYIQAHGVAGVRGSAGVRVTRVHATVQLGIRLPCFRSHPPTSPRSPLGPQPHRRCGA